MDDLIIVGSTSFIANHELRRLAKEAWENGKPVKKVHKSVAIIDGRKVIAVSGQFPERLRGIRGEIYTVGNPRDIPSETWGAIEHIRRRLND